MSAWESPLLEADGTDHVQMRDIEGLSRGAVMKTEFIPVAVVVHLALPLIAYLSLRNQHSEQANGAEVFRYAPGASWFVLLGAIVIMGVLAAIAWTAPPGKEVPLLMLMISEAAFILMTVYGVYLITLRIRVDEIGFDLTSLFGKRTVPFDQIGSATDRVTGRYRTLDVRTHKGKRVFCVTSSFIADYDALADLIQDGTKQSKVRRPT